MKSEVAVNLLLFAGTLACAWWFHWQASDLVWSLWLSSITVGYLTLIGKPIILPLLGARKIGWQKISDGLKLMKFNKDFFLGMSILLLVGFFFLAFFTIH